MKNQIAKDYMIKLNTREKDMIKMKEEAERLQKTLKDSAL
jgi:hypothetical protein